MKQLLALFNARNKEYYRDRGSLAWSFIMPPIIIGVVSLAFSGGEKELFQVGIYGKAEAPVFEESYVKVIHYEDLSKAMTRVQHHQLDMLIKADDTLQYWINEDSHKGEVLQTLLRQDHPTAQQKLVTGREIRYIDWVIPGILGMNLMFSGLFGVGYVVVRYRKNGVLKRLQATPVKPLEFLSAQILSRLIIMLAVSTLVYIVSDYFLDFIMLGSYLNLLLVAIVGNISLLSLSLVVASRISSEELAGGLLNFFSFPMLMLSEVWFSLDGAPSWMATVSQMLPLTHMVQAAREIMVNGASLNDISHNLIALAVMTALFLAVAAKLFKWRGE